MTAATLPAPTAPQTDSEVAHLYECCPDVSWCGKDITAEPEVGNEVPECPLCVLADETGVYACCGRSR
jgi:hypothetical protein